MDNLSREDRRKTMRSVRSSDTGPEMLVRRLAFSLGYRYRLHDKRLPGRPDLVFKSRRKVIFVHGCFWHGHACKAGRNQPRSNVAYWSTKIQRNRDRDARALSQLAEDGWRTLVVWECETKDADRLREMLQGFLES